MWMWMWVTYLYPQVEKEFLIEGQVHSTGMVMHEETLFVACQELGEFSVLFSDAVCLLLIMSRPQELCCPITSPRHAFWVW